MNQGLLEPLVMFFSLTNSSVMFQMKMNNIFQQLIDEGVVIIYMDDILIFGGQTMEQHQANVLQVLEMLHKHWLYLKAKKCMFRQSMVEYLSLVLSEGHVEMDPIMVASVHILPNIPKLELLASTLVSLSIQI